MNKERFSPGEWEADCTRVMVGDKLLVEQNWWDLPNEFDEARKNASLIAAAPEMYEFVNFFTGFTGQVLLKTLGKNGVTIYEEAKKIMKKARGEKTKDLEKER